jgi:hypothetical protein
MRLLVVLATALHHLDGDPDPDPAPGSQNEAVQAPGSQNDAALAKPLTTFLSRVKKI